MEKFKTIKLKTTIYKSEGDDVFIDVFEKHYDQWMDQIDEFEDEQKREIRRMFNELSGPSSPHSYKSMDEVSMPGLGDLLLKPKNDYLEGKVNLNLDGANIKAFRSKLEELNFCSSTDEK